MASRDEGEDEVPGEDKAPGEDEVPSEDEVTGKKVEDTSRSILGDLEPQSDVHQQFENYRKAHNADMDRRELQLQNYERTLKYMELKLHKEKERLKKERDDLKSLTAQTFDTQHDSVEIVVGGTRFMTTSRTLLRYDSTMAVALNHLKHFSPGKKRIFIDRDPTHFVRILNFLRDGEKSLAWLERPSLTVADIKEVKLEAEYYRLKPLVRIMSWNVIAMQVPIVKSFENCGFRAVIDGAISPPQTVGYMTPQPLTLCGMNFSRVLFQLVVFNHPVSFEGSLMCGVVFERCFFNSIVDFTDVNLNGAKFISCLGKLRPDHVFISNGAAGAACIPQHWHQV